MEQIKDLVEHRFFNNKARIIGFIMAPPTENTSITVNGTKYYYFCVDSYYNQKKYNPILVWTDTKGKAKFFDSGIYKKDSLVIIHGALRSYLVSSPKNEDLVDSTPFINLEQMHFYTFKHQVFKNNNVGMAIGQIQGYKFRELNGKYYLDTILKVDQESFSSYLKISTADKSMFQLMETDVGDMIAVKYFLISHINKEQTPIMFANATYINDHPETFMDEPTQNLDYFPPRKETPHFDDEEILKKWVEKQERMDNFLKKYFPDRYDELCHLAVLPLPKVNAVSVEPKEESAPLPLEENTKQNPITK